MRYVGRQPADNVITKHRVMAEVKEDGLKEKEERGCMTGGERDMHDVCRVCP